MDLRRAFGFGVKYLAYFMTANMYLDTNASPDRLVNYFFFFFFSLIKNFLTTAFFPYLNVNMGETRKKGLSSG